uniref:Peptidase M13 N-terminal domain-containing protein n=1 Tax=Romanomermis culicivorax TaxID=13658 RepID=A0A915KDZ3_ROMCU
MGFGLRDEKDKPAELHSEFIKRVNRAAGKAQHAKGAHEQQPTSRKVDVCNNPECKELALLGDSSKSSSKAIQFFHEHETIVMAMFHNDKKHEPKIAAYRKLFTKVVSLIAADMKLNINLEKLLEDGMEPETFKNFVKGKSKTLKCMIHIHTYFSRLNELLKATDKRTIFNYFIWYFIYHSSHLMDTRFQDAITNFLSEAYGVKGEPRSSICTKKCQSVDMAIAALYIKKYFPPTEKAEAENMIAELKKEIRKGLRTLSWMDEGTKKKAIEKKDRSERIERM